MCDHHWPPLLKIHRKAEKGPFLFLLYFISDSAHFYNNQSRTVFPFKPLLPSLKCQLYEAIYKTLADNAYQRVLECLLTTSVKSSDFSQYNFIQNIFLTTLLSLCISGLMLKNCMTILSYFSFQELFLHSFFNIRVLIISLTLKIMWNIKKMSSAPFSGAKEEFWH